MRIIDYLWGIALPLATQTYRIAEQTGNFSEQYLWFKAISAPDGGKLYISENRPGEHWELAWTERIPYNLTPKQFADWIMIICQRLPILPNNLG
jgi:hypothetical protein